MPTSDDVTDLYDGFEGEPEIRFVSRLPRGSLHTVRMWAGDFDSILEQLTPERGAWTGLALPYHLHEGWYVSNWEIPDLPQAREQLGSVSVHLLGPRAARALQAVLRLLERASLAGVPVHIEYD